MAWRRKKSDPITERARDLNAEIASLEAEIKRLDSRLNRGAGQKLAAPVVSPVPEVRTNGGVLEETPPACTRHEPVFEEINQANLVAPAEPLDTPDHYNELGMRKFDLPAWWRRLKANFHGPTTSNPKLVSYLAAGGIQGLSPLRREKRVARNRFIVLVSFLFLVLLGILIVFVKNR
jgi:hypothetical protein